MSASTVSITANPASARRRPVVVGEKKGGVEFQAAEVGAARENGGVGDDKFSSGKDLSNSIREEVFLERSKEPVPTKKDKGGSSIAARRARKVLPKPEKPRWLIVLRVFSKNFLLLLVLLGLAQMVRKLALNSYSPSGMPIVASDLESRIADVDGLVKKTAKMMQVQVEIVDKKIANEVAGLRKEVSKKIEENSVVLANEVKRLQDRSEGLEKAVSELRSMEFLTRDDLEKLYDELKAIKVNEEAGGSISLDDVRIVAKQIIEKEIERHAADGLGMIDYALASGGATVVKHSEPLITNKGVSWLYRKNQNGVHSEAAKMLKPSFGEPGACFPLKGSRGFVQIRLRTAIIPEAVTLEHVAKSVAYDRSSAPKDCRLSGWLQGREMFRLAEFSYDLEKSNAQTFKVLDPRPGIVDTIRLDFMSNHGSPSHTCIYRLRVHGREPASVSVMATRP